MASAYTAVSGGISSMNNLQYQRNTNEALDDYNARAATLKGDADASNARIQGSQMVAQQRTAYANSGIDATSGTAAAVQADTAAQSELNAQTIQNNAARQAWGFKLAKGEAEQQYNAGVTQAENQGITGVSNSGSSLITAVAGA